MTLTCVTLKYCHFDALKWTVSSSCQSLLCLIPVHRLLFCMVYIGKPSVLQSKRFFLFIWFIIDSCVLESTEVFEFFFSCFASFLPHRIITGHVLNMSIRLWKGNNIKPLFIRDTSDAYSPFPGLLIACVYPIILPPYCCLFLFSCYLQW